MLRCRNRMIGLALSGGGSRAIAFHLGCLRALNEIGLLNRVNIISTISGGAVIGAYYAYTPGKAFAEFESDIRGFLERGFQRAILRQLWNPRNAYRSVANVVTANFDLILEWLCKRPPKFRGYLSRTDLFKNVLQRRVFPSLRMSSSRRSDMEVVIGACDLRTESAFRFGNSKSGSWRLGDMVSGDVEVSLAVAASAAYPLFLPALDRQWMFSKGQVETEHRVLLSDGGIYDNLGVRVLEPGRDPNVSIHSFPCEYLIVCNAGQGQASGESAPTRFYRRMESAFSMVHRLVGNATMHRLHELRRANRLKGFILPYLGQQDDDLPSRPKVLVHRSEVVDYPTDFSAMSEQWINKISNRGEQLTRLLASCYLSDLLS
jgi:NTE family protein